MIQLSPEQQRAVDHFKNNGMTVVLGRPGSGKTTLIKSLFIPNEKTLLCSPTGCAANRISFATGLDAYVISKVEFDSNMLKFYTGCNLIIDEASMINIQTGARLLSFLQPKRVCFIGDIHQLPCITGVPLLNTMAVWPEVTKITLNMNHRQRDLNSGLVKTLNTMGEHDFSQPYLDDNFKIIACESDERVITAASELYLKQPESQMLALTNKMCQALNDATESSKNPRIVCVQNLYAGDTMLVANGITGQIVDPNEIRYDNGFVDYLVTVNDKPPTFKSKFVCARCMTVHKAQGNEFDVPGIIVLSNWGGASFPLELMYTALSRFKHSVSVYGTTSAINKAFSGKFNVNDYDIDIIQEANHSENIKRQRTLDAS